MVSVKQKIYPWFILTACCALAVASIGISVNCMGVFISPMAEAMHTGIGSVSMYLTILNLASGFFGPVAAKLYRKWPLRPMVLISALICIAAYLLMTRITAVWQLYFFAVLIGIVKSFYCTVVLTSLVAAWFDKGMGTASGISMGFSGLAGAAFSPVFASLIEKGGWQSGFLWTAIFTAIMVLPFVFFIYKTPEEIGLVPRGREEGGADTEKTASPAPVSEGLIRTDALRRTALILLCIASFTICFACGMGSQVASYAVSLKLTAAFGAALTSAVMIGNMSSKFLAGIFCDRIGPKRCGTISMILGIAGVTLLGLAPASFSAALILGALLLGLCYSVCGVTFTVVTKELFGLERYTQAFSYISMLGYIGSAVAYTAIGYSYDILRSFRPAVLFCAGLVLLTLILFRIVYAKCRKQ